MSKLDCCRCLLLEREESEILSFIVGPLRWLIEGSRTVASLFYSSFDDVATSGVTALRTCVALLEQQLEAAKGRLKIRDSKLLNRFPDAG